jgi:HNH endonuclease
MPRGDFWSKVQHGDPSSCWIWLGPKTSGGYGTTTHRGVHTTAHRVAFLLSGRSIPPGHYVLHTCDNPACCNPAHLHAGTQRENIAEMHNRGRAGDCRVFGEAHGRAKLTDRQVRQIHVLSLLGLSQQCIADTFDISQSQTGRILRGENRQLGAA